jgi:hypothetical protein
MAKAMGVKMDAAMFNAGGHYPLCAKIYVRQKNPNHNKSTDVAKIDGGQDS